MTFHFDFEPIKVESIKNMFTVTNTKTTNNLRDRFAEIVLGFEMQREWETQEEMAAYCYQAADAMLAAREKPTEEKPSKPKVINLNDSVRVKLTDHGRAVHAKDHADCWGSAGVIRPYTPPKEDADGWSKWTLWVLMQTFGPHTYLGGRPCFEADIEVVE